MSETTQGPNEATQVADQQADTSTKEVGHVAAKMVGFGPDGAKEYQKIAQEYLIGLEQLSRVLARKRKSEVVSPFDVQTAAVSMGDSPERKLRHLSELGTLFVGAGLAYLGNVIFAPPSPSPYTFKNALLVFLPLLVGCILYAFSWGRG